MMCPYRYRHFFIEKMECNECQGKLVTWMINRIIISRKEIQYICKAYQLF